MVSKNEEKSLSVAEFDLPAMTDEMAKVYEGHLGVGTEEWQGETLPKLQLITGNNIENIGELAGGLAPMLGNYLYTGDMTMAKDVEVVLCFSSGGFYTAKNEVKPGEKPTNFNIIVGGFIVDGLKPFQMYISGGKASRWFEFQELMRPLTKGKFKFPLYSFKVKLGMYKEKNLEYNKMNYFYTFELVKNEKGQVVMESDKGIMDMYLKMHDKLKDIVADFRLRRETDKQGKAIGTTPATPAVMVDGEEGDIIMAADISKKVAEAKAKNGFAKPQEEIDTNDIPF